jgi:MFS family permease
LERYAPVTPPPLFLLQLFNALIALGSLLTLLVGISTWGLLKWDPWQIGLVTTLANLCYGGVVAQGGVLADRWGRARAGMLGAAIGVVGCVAALVFDHALVAVAAAMLGFAGPALFYPGSAGLFSDAEGAAGTATPPLHRKVSRYNLGWALGNFLGFFVFGRIAGDPHLGYAIAAAAFLAVLLGLWRWRRLPPCPPPAEGDRAPHPALSRLTLMYRVNLFLACTLGMAVTTQLERSLALTLSKGRAVELTSLLLSCYAATYILVFVIFGSWTGWILKPWRMWMCQAGLVLGSGLLLAVVLCDAVSAPWLALCGILLGTGYGTSYTGSIYYSLRLPHGAARAAGLHETFIGLGNTLGPLALGIFLSSTIGSLVGIGWFALATGVIALAFQALMIPGAARLGAR